MITFWLFSAALIVLALLFLWLPLIRNKKQSPDDDIDRNALNVQIFKGRVAELERELAEGNLDQEAFGQLKGELEQNLLEEVDEQQPELHKQRMPVAVPVFLSVSLPAIAMVLYLQWGSSQLLDEVPQAAAASESQHDNTDIDAQIDALKAELEADPDNVEGWFMLARTYLTLERFQLAVDTFEKLTSMVGEHPQILSQQAQALYLLNNSRITPAVQNIVDRSLAIDPADPGTLGFLGIASFESGQYRTAIDYWNRALNSGNPAVNREGLTSAIEQAQAELAKIGEEYQPEPVVAADEAKGAELSVRVSLAESLQGQAEDTATVFVYAQDVDGPRMPLAAVRINLSELPTTVLLNDAQAMTPAAKLSSAEQVRVSAMVSHSGTATPAAGDFVGATESLTLADSQDGVSLIIDRVVE